MRDKTGFFNAGVEDILKTVDTGMGEGIAKTGGMGDGISQGTGDI